MSQAPSMPVFTDALIGDTTHLSMEEFGAYLMILFVTWRNNGVPLPDDDKRLARICRMSEKKWSAIRPTISEFFDLSEGVWRQKRLEKEWQYVSQQRAKQSEKGKKSAQARSLKNNETPSTVVGQRLEPQGQPEANPQPQPHKEDTEAKASGANAANEPQASQSVVIDLFPVEQTPSQMMWGTYLSELVAMTGKPKADLRKLIGKWSKAYGGEQAVCEAISDASARQPPLADPLPWIIATLKTRSNSNGRHSKVQRERYSWHDLGRDCELFEGSA
jgi:uncharacterized protein YdaU (DUF1376 family)